MMCHRTSEKGQALLMVTLSLALLLGMAGLVVDLGFGKYSRKTAQAAADSAALAAAAQALSAVGQTGTPACGANVQCQSMGACPKSGNLSNGCAYATQNELTGGWQTTIQIAAGTTSPAPGAPNVAGVQYWVQASVTQNVPQLFSAIFGHTLLSTGATATAAVFPTSVTPSLVLLNRSTDCFVSAITLGLVCGENFLSALNSNVTATGGIYMASTNPQGTPLPNVAAGTIIGATTVTSPFTYIQGHGGINTLGLTNWTAAPTNGFPDGDEFRDPMRGKGQPPAPTGLTNHPVAGGVLTGNLLSGTPLNLAPGNYYATNPLTGAPLGTPITVLGNVSFTDGQSTPCGGFCSYVFFGGLITGALSTVTFSPGEYVFAGAQPVAGGPGVALSVGVNSVVKDLTPAVNGQATQNTDAGEIFVYTDMNYPGLQLPVNLANAGISLPQAIAGLQGGLGYSVTLHGLNASNSAVPAALAPFAPVLLWQDQANTTVKYTSTGTLDLSCGGICSNILSVPGSQQMILQASTAGGQPGVNLYGTIYSPRAAYITELGLLPGDTIRGPLQIVTGALEIAVDAKLSVTPVPVPLTRRTVTLIQ